MAMLDPGRFTFADWSQYFSENARQARESKGLGEEMFPAFVEFVRQRTSQHELNEITRLVFVKEGETTYLAVIIRVARASASTDGFSMHLFLKQDVDGWINWTAPSDMAFDSDLGRVHVGLPPASGGEQQ